MTRSKPWFSPANSNVRGKIAAVPRRVRDTPDNFTASPAVWRPFLAAHPGKFLVWSEKHRRATITFWWDFTTRGYSYEFAGEAMMGHGGFHPMYDGQGDIVTLRLAARRHIDEIVRDGNL